MSDESAVLVAIARLEEKMDNVNDKITRHLAQDDSVHSDHERRVRSLEKFSWRVHGMSGLLAMIAAGLVSWLFKGGVG